ncbi:MAG: hypothetical protein M3N39_06105 [Pseudomonadota bacterium]|nr:hypothetical protein [Pseudomonadota bacterium]
MSAQLVLVETAGWAGALLILAAYLLLSMGKVNGRSALYQAMNVVGAAGFIVNGWYHGALPSAVLNVIWMLIGAVALWRILKRKGSPASVT